MSKKYFTLEEANALIPDLNDWVPRLQELYSLMHKGIPDVQKARAKSQSDYQEPGTKGLCHQRHRNGSGGFPVYPGGQRGLSLLESSRKGNRVLA